MNKPAFRVKPYAHSKYRFVVRAKLDGKWKRSYFENEAEASAYAKEQNQLHQTRARQQGATDRALPPPKPPAPVAPPVATPESQTVPNEPPESAVTWFAIYAEGQNGYTTEASMATKVTPGVPQIIRFLNIETLHPKQGGRWRIDPINQQGMISISSIQIIRDSDNEVLYRAAEPVEFQGIECSDGLLKYDADGVLLLIATRPNPQIFLPHFDLPTSGSCRMEISLQAHPAVPTVLAAAIAWEKTFDQLTSALDASQGEIGRQKQMLEQSNAGLAAQQQALDESRAEVARQAHQLQETVGQLKAAQERSAALEGAVNAQEGRFAGLQESVDSFRTELERARQQGRVKEAQIATLYQAVSEAHSHWAQAVAGLNAARDDSHEQRRRAEALEAALGDAVEEAQIEATRLTEAIAKERSAKNELQTRVEADARQVSALQEELRELKLALEAAHSQWNQLAVDLREAQFQKGEFQAQTELDIEQIAALERRQQELHLTLERREDEKQRLAAVLEMQKVTRIGLEQRQAQLERRLTDIARFIASAGEEFKRGDAGFPAIVQVISENIRRIGNPSLWWRLAQFLGILRLAPAGVPRTADERRAIANDLDASLREICHSLASARNAPQEAAAEIPRLFQLGRQTSGLLNSLKISGLLPRRPHAWNMVHRARRGATNPAIPEAVRALFDPAWYLGQYPDVAELGGDPLGHYFSSGAAEGRNPNPVFDTKWYLAKNPGIDPARLNPLQHYCETGAREGRDPSPLFDGSWYVACNPDIAAADLNPLLHYLVHGAREGRDPHPLFNSAWYHSENPETRGLNPIEHYLRWGGSHGLSPHPLFDPRWYLAQNGDVAQSGANPLVHYLEFGGVECRQPHALFDPRWYLHQVGDDPDAAANPLRHYVLVGARARRSPSPLFDPKFYVETYPETAEWGDLLEHYLRLGWRQGYRTAASIDPKVYVPAHPSSPSAAGND